MPGHRRYPKQKQDSARNPVNTLAPKRPKSFPAPTEAVLRNFPIDWNFQEAVGNTWLNSYEHFVKGTFKEQEYLFVLKGTAYGRSYYIYRGDSKKSLFRVLNLEELSVGLTALTAETKAPLIQYLLHPSTRIRKMAEKLAKERN